MTPATGTLLRRRVPLLVWLQRSDASSRRADLLAGMTVAAMLIPLGMAYAGVLALLVGACSSHSASGMRLLETLEAELDRRPGLRAGGPLVLDLAGVPGADLSGPQALAAVDAACSGAGVELHLAGSVTGSCRRSSGPISMAGSPAGSTRTWPSPSPPRHLSKGEMYGQLRAL